MGCSETCRDASIQRRPSWTLLRISLWLPPLGWGGERRSRSHTSNQDNHTYRLRCSMKDTAMSEVMTRCCSMSRKLPWQQTNDVICVCVCVCVCVCWGRWHREEQLTKMMIGMCMGTRGSSLSMYCQVLLGK